MLPEALLSVIDRELLWREREMALAKIQLHRAVGEERSFRYGYRCFAAMNYAHFEGYTKRVLEETLSQIIARNTKQSDCSQVMREALFGRSARKMVNNLSNSDLLEKVFMSDQSIELIGYPLPEEVFDIASMSFNNFARAISCVGLEVSSFETYRGVINKLTSVRHECAHGERVSLDPLKTQKSICDDMFYLQDRIIDAMHELAVQIVDHLSVEMFHI